MAATLEMALADALSVDAVSSAATELRIVIPLITKSPLVIALSSPIELAPAEVAAPILSTVILPMLTEIFCPALAPT